MGTYIAVDEAIIIFRGKMLYKIKIKNKPIDKEFKT
jgi:hypothetical protein